MKVNKVVKYLNLDEKEIKRQQSLANSGLQEIESVILPSESNKKMGKHLGWPVATMVDDTIIVVFSTLIDSDWNTVRFNACVPSILCSNDGGKTWSFPDKLPDWEKGNNKQTGPGMRAIGTTLSGKIILSISLGIFISADKGKTWEKVESKGLIPGGNAGPRIIEHPDFGIIFPSNHKSSNQRKGLTLFLNVSRDEGKTWSNIEVETSSIYHPCEPTIFQLNNEFAVVTRNQSGPTTGATGYWRTWSYMAQFVPQNINQINDISELEFDTDFLNIFDRRMDTPDIIFNPVSRRIEMLATKRNEGFPYRDNGYMTLNMWSIDPDEFRMGKSNWRFECTLLRSKGMDSRSTNPDFPPREGMHPAGTVIDKKRGQQHIFIFAGNRKHKGPDSGKTGIFRISRSLNTKEFQKNIWRLNGWKDYFTINENFSDLDNWQLSSCPVSLQVCREDRDVVKQKNKSLPEGNVKVDNEGLFIKTEEPGYYGLHHKKAVIFQNYRLEFKVRIEKYTEQGDTFGIVVNYGAQKQQIIWKHDAIYHQKNPDIRIASISLDHDWHIWSVEMKDGIASVKMDGKHIGNYPAIKDDRLGENDVPVSIYVKTESELDPAEVRVEYFKINNYRN